MEFWGLARLKDLTLSCNTYSVINLHIKISIFACCSYKWTLSQICAYNFIMEDNLYGLVYTFLSYKIWFFV